MKTINSMLDHATNLSEGFTRFVAAQRWLHAPVVFFVTILFVFYRFIAWVVGASWIERLDVRNKTVLITGASSGVGRALAYRFHKAGAKLILTARSVDKLQQLCAELKTVSCVSF
jgi:NADPH:quinone reductase-like Zn-dependent oxidoreductase